MDTVNDNVGHVLNRDLPPISNVNVGTAAIDRLEAVHNQLLLEFNHHVMFEDDPQRPILENGMAEGARFGIDRIIVTGVTHDVVPSITTAHGITSKTNCTISETLSPEIPPAVTPPAIINRIGCPT
ncbi:hypothetical protein SLE2022_209740 [Rubroshorea leprosula]